MQVASLKGGVAATRVQVLEQTATRIVQRDTHVVVAQGAIARRAWAFGTDQDRENRIRKGTSGFVIPCRPLKVRNEGRRWTPRRTLGIERCRA
eukprot:scaffold363_cov331-Pavlova_lutheri.AAC.46